MANEPESPFRKFENALRQVISTPKHIVIERAKRERGAPEIRTPRQQVPESRDGTKRAP